MVTGGLYVGDYSTANCEVHNYIWNAMQSKIEVNISISKFKISSKKYLQVHSLQSKYTNNNILLCIM